MPITIKQQLEKIQELKQLSAAYEGMIKWVSAEFVSKDGRKAQKAIRCDVPPGLVPDTKIEEALVKVNDLKKAVDHDITTLESLFIEEKKAKS